MTIKKPKITDKMQEVAADILTQFMFARTMKDVDEVWHILYEKYELCDDPFTGIPCSLKECCKMNKYELQIALTGSNNLCKTVFVIATQQHSTTQTVEFSQMMKWCLQKEHTKALATKPKQML